MNKKLIYALILVILSAIAYWLYQIDHKTTLQADVKDFAIEDTAAIDKIFIANKSGQQILLTRQPTGNWLLNDSLIANETNVQVMLKTLKRIRIKQPVGLAAIENVKKQLATLGIKVEVYQGNKIAKVFYVGGPTNDTRGTYMILASSETPVIAHLPGWEGYLTERFKPVIEDWRSQHLMKFEPNELVRITLNYPDTPQYSFTIDWENFNQFRISPNITNLDSNKVRRIVKTLALVTSFSYLTDQPNIRDSVVNNYQPVLQLAVQTKKGNTVNLWLYNRNINYLPMDPSVIGWFLDEEHFFYYNPDNRDFGVFQKDRHWPILQKYHDLQL